MRRIALSGHDRNGRRPDGKVAALRLGTQAQTTTSAPFADRTGRTGILPKSILTADLRAVHVNEIG